jgi:hypothetical protein
MQIFKRNAAGHHEPVAVIGLAVAAISARRPGANDATGAVAVEALGAEDVADRHGILMCEIVSPVLTGT